MKKIVILLIALMTIVSLSGCSEKKEVIKITHKEYTEQRIAGQLLSVFLESRGFETEVVELTGTMLCYNALENGNVDLYAEFTGSIYTAVFKQSEILSKEETFNYVKENSEKEHGITWLKPLGWNNTFVLSVRKETAAEYNLTTISDLAAVSDEMILGCDTDFAVREDGLLGLQKLYTGLSFSEEVSMDQGLTYAALRDGKIDVNSSYSTDGRIAKYELVNLVDDKNFFPPYYITPILRVEYAADHPGVVEALEELAGHWNEADLQVYNLRVEEGEAAKDIATIMLQDAGLLPKGDL